MQWIEVSVPTRSDEIDDVCAQLAELGAGGMVVEDETDFQQFLEQNQQYWDYVDQAVMEKMKDCETCVTIYVADNPQGMEELMQVRQILARLKAQDPDGKYGRLELEMKDVDEEDWSNAWKKYYHPVQVGEHLVVCPSWEAYDRKPDEVVLTLNPGMAFGTGTHDTTRLCMELLEKYITPQDTVLDVGCGRGILAITAALLGANKIIGCDTHEVAVNVEGANAARNGVQDRIPFPPGDLSSQSRFIRAAFVRAHSLCEATEESRVSQFFHILTAVEQQRGCCQLENGKYEITLYTSCCNATRGIYYYTTYDNRQITAVDMHKAPLDGNALVRYPLIQKQQIFKQN